MLEGDPCPEILSKKFLLQILTNYTQFNVVLCADSEYVILVFLEGFLACKNDTLPIKTKDLSRPVFGFQNICANLC